MPQHTRVSYLYRDASNWKQRSEFIVEGEVSFADLEPFLFDRAWFIPDRIGLKSLVPKPRNEDDHELHELYAFEPCEGGTIFCGREEFIQRMRKTSADGWFSRHRSLA